MKNLFFILLLSLIIGISNLVAQENGMIRGKILDENGVPLPQANIVTEVYGNLVGTVTDYDGNFSLKPLPEGKYDITVTFIGYNDYKLKGIEIDDGQVYFAKTINMSNNVRLVGVDVVARKPIDADQTITKLTIKSAELKTMPHGGSINGILRAISSDIQITKDNKIILRGSRPGNSITIIDHVKSLGDASVPSLAIGSVTVYSGGVPAKYGDFTGGVILITTKSFFDYYYEYKD